MNEKLKECCDMVARVITESLDEAIRDEQRIEYVQHSAIYLHIMEIAEPEGDEERFSPMVFDEEAFGMQADSMPPQMLLELFKITSTKARLGEKVFNAIRRDDNTKAPEGAVRFFATGVNAGAKAHKINVETGDKTEAEIVMVSLETIDKDTVFLSWQLHADENGVLVGYTADEPVIGKLTKEHVGTSQNIMCWPEDELADPELPVEKVN